MEEGGGFSKWDELLADALGLVFKKLKLVELLTVIPCVCKSWRKVVMGPYCWQKIDILDWIYDYKYLQDHRQVDKMLRLLLPRSGGSLLELRVSHISNDGLLFIASHAQCLQTLELTDSDIEDVAMERAAPMLSAITSLDLSYCVCLGPRAFQAIGKHCKSLTSFRRFRHVGEPLNNVDEDDVAQAIASSMSHLKKLAIHNSLIHTPGVVEIIENCKHLELLDVRGCAYVDLDDNLLRRFPNLKVLGPGLEDGNDSDDNYSLTWVGEYPDYDHLNEVWMEFHDNVDYADYYTL